MTACSLPATLLCAASQVVVEAKGMGPDWFLDYVVVANATTGVTAKFPFANWFSAEKGWSHLLTPEGRQADTVSGGTGAREAVCQ